MSYLQNVFKDWEQIGVFDTLLPFMLIFVIIYAVMHKTKVLGEKKQFNVAIALVMSLLTVVATPIIEIINKAIPNVSIVIVAVIMALILIGVFGGQVSWIGGSLSGWIALIAFGIISYIFARAAGWDGTRLPNWLGWLDDPQTRATLIVVLVFGIVIYYVTKEEKKDDSGGSKFMKSFGDMFKPN
jgi:hypothetical protein